jgi:hypothetical protein
MWLRTKRIHVCGCVREESEGRLRLRTKDVANRLEQSLCAVCPCKTLGLDEASATCIAFIGRKTTAVIWGMLNGTSPNVSASRFYCIVGPPCGLLDVRRILEAK